MKTLDLTSVITDIKIILAQNPGSVKRVGVFGSLAKGNTTDKSDIDIAIEYLGEVEFDFSRFVKFCEVCEYISESIAKNYGRTVDLVHVEEGADSLLFEIQDDVIWI